jgi:hypothetical protein
MVGCSSHWRFLNSGINITLASHSTVPFVSLLLLLSFYISPHSEITTGNFGRALGPVITFSILRKVNKPSTRRPNTTCFPSKKSAFAQVIKNYTVMDRRGETPLVFIGTWTYAHQLRNLCYLAAIRVRSCG